jgi:hypothetical protein
MLSSHGFNTYSQRKMRLYKSKPYTVAELEYGYSRQQNMSLATTAHLVLRRKEYKPLTDQSLIKKVT